MKKIGGVPQSYSPYVVGQYASSVDEGVMLYVSSDKEDLNDIKRQIQFFYPHKTVLTFPAWDCSPYDRVSPSKKIVAKRLEVILTLLKYAAGRQIVVVVPVSALLMKLPPSSYFQQFPILYLKEQHTYNRDELIQILIQLGFQRVDAVYEVGEFSVRGSLIDIFPNYSSYPYRLDFFDDVLEKIKIYDPLTQRSIKLIHDPVTIGCIDELNLDAERISCFRKNYRALFGSQATSIYTNVSAGRKFSGIENWMPLFFEKMQSLMEMVSFQNIIFHQSIQAELEDKLEQIQYNYHLRCERIPGDNMEPYLPVPTDNFFLSKMEIEGLWKNGSTFLLHELSLKDEEDFKGVGVETLKISEGMKDTWDWIQSHGQFSDKRFLLCANDSSSVERFHKALDEKNLPYHHVKYFEDIKKEGIHTTHLPINSGFQVGNLIALSERDVFGADLYRIKKRQKRSTENFFLQASQFSVGDYVVHAEHGIAQYQGLLALNVNNTIHDCVTLIYEGGDKLFLPIENIDLLTRYGGEDAQANLDRLGTTGWQQRKSKVKNRLKMIAEHLINLAAKRQLEEAPRMSPLEDLWDRFLQGFPFVETEDQERSIEEVLVDLNSGHPMDRLICGDVGFGKTEVAMRAAFAAVSAGYQVLILTPTTLLCRQHYINFSQRFAGFPFKIECLSRLVSVKDAEQVREGFKERKVDILIATHAAFSDKLQPGNLGLLIVDEEQHFGVKQKEKIKNLQKNVHVLTLTATPIPRTLQLSLTGVRELSLITSPPVDRLSVNTFIMVDDKVTIKEAIKREIKRGGQVFYVTPRIEFLGKIEETIQSMNLGISYCIAHGKLSPKELEDVMTGFYDKKYDMLIATNIIESGIDISSANTMIIHRSDLFGLAQLYQLRGRIGRSKAQGYAYLMIPDEKAISHNALKRLKVMQTLDHLGAGFKLASHDLDIRGAGNILGEEQSGHIKEVGVELYQTLLQEAILMSRAKDEIGEIFINQDWSPQINLGLSVLIPEVYVADLNQRIDLYKRIAKLHDPAEMKNFCMELMDRFGPIPQETRNLIEIVQIKNLCKKAMIERLDAGVAGLLISFHKNEFPKPDKLIEYIQKKGRLVKIRPDQKVFFSIAWKDSPSLIKGVKIICMEVGNLLMVG